MIFLGIFLTVNVAVSLCLERRRWKIATIAHAVLFTVFFALLLAADDTPAARAIMNALLGEERANTAAELLREALGAIGLAGAAGAAGAAGTVTAGTAGATATGSLGGALLAGHGLLAPILIIELTVLLQAIITGAVAVTVIVNRILRRTPDGLRDINDQDDKKRGCRRGAYRRGFGGDAVGLYRLYCVLRC
ncbi:MAG: hypothetical protein SOZ78_08280 [Eubacteriales bacterium]|nr:hypothetical protein [Eubacteriales bacterium]